MSESRKKILVADDETNIRRVLGGILQREGHEVISASDGVEALNLLAKHDINAVITDLRMPRLDGMELLRQVVQEYPDIPVIILTAHGSVDNAVAAVKLGAFDYIEKPFEHAQLKQIIANALRTHELRRCEVGIAGAAKGKGRYGIVGHSAPMQAVYNVIEKVAHTPSTVLITGESGTGKELIAKALHEQSQRKDFPLIKVNCAAIPDTLIESELFGYEKGAFTGATSSKPGRFELADKGTLFLDEIGEVPMEMQVKLLRALQEGEFERVGGIRTIKVEVRLVAATNRDLATLIGQSKFREDLFYRLNVVPIHVAPLRERRDDIPDLVGHILEKFRPRLGKEIDGVDMEAMNCLVKYSWPGNVRELENVLERTILFCAGKVIQLGDLPAELRSPDAAAISPVSKISSAELTRLTTPALGSPAAPAPAPDTATTEASAVNAATVGTVNAATVAADASLKDIVKAETEKVERNFILAALEETGWNVTHAAKKLKISRKSLQIKMKELGLRDKES